MPYAPSDERRRAPLSPILTSRAAWWLPPHVASGKAHGLMTRRRRTVSDRDQPLSRRATSPLTLLTVPGAGDGALATPDDPGARCRS